MVPKLDLTAGALAIKRVSGVAGVQDNVVLSVLSGLFFFLEHGKAPG